jgi:nicotinamidase-related amidase
MLKIENTILIVIDLQEKLVRAMHQKEQLIENSRKLITGLQLLNVPAICTEQNPRGLGNTIPEISSLFGSFNPLPKFSFSCCGDSGFMKEVSKYGRKQVLLAGIEAHVCVYQTAVDLLNLGYEVQFVSDCMSSRTAGNLNVAIERLTNEGVKITSTEMLLFELLGKAEGNLFKEISKIVK